MVNAGAVAICTSFLSKEDATKESEPDSSEYSREQIETLRKDLDYFLLLCAFAIKLHKSLVGSEQQQLHQQVCQILSKRGKQIETAYADVCL